MSFFGDMFGGGDSTAAMMKKQNKQDVEKINTGMSDIYKTFAGFTPQFYEGAQKEYMFNALPTVMQQGQDASTAANLSFANRGLFDSSAHDNFGNRLAEEMSQSRSRVTSNSIEYKQSLQQAVQEEKARLQAQLHTSVQPGQMTQNMLGGVANMGAPSPFEPLGQGLGAFGKFAEMRAQTRK